ncbi:sulfotransferase family 2 domain-containing protein [Pseudohalocynthiibacter aestuariivivens]|jgi:Sulfotransferase family|uniref:Sulfotransferase family 2 domain-containing protein n=1 Tax=Pseudohalocynthiibacter aestuariivivens TaxID=1591409 RepID=A0ABV5JFB0_9RHOB|nr:MULTISPECIES: sulfotransferase family 2 domain-containing protein [Pseudohalocynthiibacter]MBS9717102.1 sulfotransferase family 2 domain-containing protein [Pseudohalocynthiibacter aestuariivivens]MCK0103974.1 sulfotransferase family protein [Pseudohalocynthiibacter sp. F2068]
MIISRGRRYIFIHIPKTGGTSMALALETRAMKDDIMLGDTPKAVKRRHRVKGVPTSGRLWKHSRLAGIYGLVTQEDVENFYIFTMVRNPWDRLVSYYRWLRVQTFKHPAVTLAKVHNFSNFLNHAETKSSIRREPYGSYVRDANGVERCALFVRLEHLEQDLNPLESHLGFAMRPFPQTNASKREQDYRTVYSDQDAELVQTLCSEDIRRFGYAF